MAWYTDGHGYCFGCRAYYAGTSTSIERTPRVSANLLPFGEPCEIPARQLSLETCEKWRYNIGEYKGQTVHIANYCNDQGQVIAQKVRFANKEFEFLGDAKHAGLYGQWLWRSKGKMVVVTEGEIDALSVSQAQGNKWPVVSVPNGAAGAKKAIMRALEWLEGFESVIFMFDNDEPGIAAAKECAPLLTPGKAKIANLPLKDANELLKAGRSSELIEAIWSAKVYRPDGIVDGRELWERIRNEKAVPSVPYPWQGLNELTKGMRKGELITVTAGTGIGKSQIVREIAHHLIKSGESVGYIALEEAIDRTALGIMSIDLNKPLHLSREGVEEAELKSAFERTVGSGRLYLYDHFGSLDSENLVQRVRYLNRGCGCNWIILDHLSIVVSGMGDGDERRLIDNVMTALRSLVAETGAGMILVSHLRRPDGDKGHEDGAQISIGQLRGSGAIAQLSDVVIGLERNQQDESTKHVSTVRLLKARWTGSSGIACYLQYDPITGRLHELDAVKGEPVETSAF